MATSHSGYSCVVVTCSGNNVKYFFVQSKYFSVQSKYFYLERHVDDVPLGGDDHLHHHHEEQGQELIDLAQNTGFRLGINKDSSLKVEQKLFINFLCGENVCSIIGCIWE